jgi:hypothetical protein
MDVQTRQTNLTEKLESFLDRACQAEAAGNKEEAEHIFRLALCCEELSRSDSINPVKQLQKTVVVNGNTKSLTATEIQGKNHGT